MPPAFFSTDGCLSVPQKNTMTPVHFLTWASKRLYLHDTATRQSKQVPRSRLHPAGHKGLLESVQIHAHPFLDVQKVLSTTQRISLYTAVDEIKYTLWRWPMSEHLEFVCLQCVG